MESITYKILMCLGILVAVVGVIAGIKAYDQDLVDHESASREVHYKDLNNEFAEAFYEVDKARADTMRLFVMMTIGGGLGIGGALFGVAMILKVLINRRDSANQSEKRLQELITELRAAN